MKPSKLILITLIALINICTLFGQGTFSGVIRDKETGEPLIGATVNYGKGATITDFDGNFEVKLTNGKYDIIFSYVGYVSQNQTFDINSDNQPVNIFLSPIILKEVVVTADIAKERKTPIAFTNIPTLKMQEELASQDIPMILNSTPGAYATQGGGGDGDARITIRGFNQRNVAVMLDGIPVNDMENGQVYWSNWFGLDLVTQTMQVQRGLGASKLSIPSVGGTINILTKGIDAKKSFSIQNEVGSGGYNRTTLGLTSGRLKGNWSVSSALSYKSQTGWVDATPSKAWFYYLRIDKEFKNHLISLSGFGAPQKHGQRTFRTSIATVDSTYAKEVGVSQDYVTDIDNIKYGLNQGLRYNPNWGWINGKVQNTAINYYHKPQFSLRHSWQINHKTFLANVAYLSIGNGGGVGTMGNTMDNFRNEFGIIEMDTVIAFNKSATIFKPAGKSERALRASINNHFWYGLLSTLKYDISKKWVLSAGIDARFYRGDHWREVYDLLGGDYIIATGSDASNALVNNATTKLAVGDKFRYNYSGFVRWFGGFGLIEYSNEKVSAFFNISGANSQYRLEDYMKPKLVTLSDTSFYVRYGDTISHNNVNYTINSVEAKNQQLGWVNIPSFTFKSGISYNLNKSMSVYVNAGYLSKAQRFNNVLYVNSGQDRVYDFKNYKNEVIEAIEGGYSLKTKVFSTNINAYWTEWLNKPLDFPITIGNPLNPGDPDDRIPVNLPGINARHIGLEADFAYRINSKLTLEALASIGNWKWTSQGELNVPIQTDQGEFIYTDTIYTKGLHVGDAAQLQFGGMLRYEPFKGFYVKLKSTYFGNNYANFQPESLTSDNHITDVWKIPAYNLFDFHTGYNFNYKKKMRGAVRLNVLNILNTTYISDATDNGRQDSKYNNNDALSASVLFGNGRKFTASIELNF
ncbi:MAG: TonB-dependent receptor [Saprospiraceae bacterium]|nr:TonB-dependent receptor [Saprospiraceae bacterium]